MNSTMKQRTKPVFSSTPDDIKTCHERADLVYNLQDENKRRIGWLKIFEMEP